MTPLEQVVVDSQRLRPRSREIYLSAVRSFLKSAGPEPGGWTPEAVQRWHRNLSRRMAPQSANLFLAGLRYASRRLSAIRMNPALNFADPIEPLRVETRKRRRAIPFEKALAIISTCSRDTPLDMRDRAILVLGFRTGMRRSGILGIRFSDIDGSRVEIELKGGRRHAVFIDEETRAALDHWLGCLRGYGIFSGHVFRALTKPTIEGTVKVFDRPISASSCFKMIQARGKMVGVKVSPHIMRHSCVSWLVDRGFPAHRIRELTGHKTNQMIDNYTTDVNAATDPLGNHLPRFFR